MSSDENEIQDWEDCGEKPAMGLPYVVQWNDGSVSAYAEAAFSHMANLADCGWMDEVKAVYASDENGELVKVTIGPQVRVESDDESPFWYATSRVMAGKRLVGCVHYSDH